jgi:hypothetical protein
VCSQNKPFAQENSLDPGTGLGLSIVRQIVGSLGGKIDLHSAKGVGTRVRVSIPVVRAIPTAEISHSAEEFVSTQKMAQGIRACLLEAESRVELSPESNISDAVSTIPSVRNSVAHISVNWFGIDLHFKRDTETVSGDFEIILIVETLSNFADLKSGRILDSILNSASASEKHAIPLIMMLCRTTHSSYSVASSIMSRYGAIQGLIIEYMTQPYATIFSILSTLY